jgi:U3 small nucleolar RNA-associated protein 7
MDTQTAAADGLVAVPKTSRSRQVSAATPNRSTPSRKDRRLDQRRVGVDWKGAQDKKLRRNLKSLETKYQNASQKARDAEVLLENTAGTFVS